MEMHTSEPVTDSEEEDEIKIGDRKQIDIRQSCRRVPIMQYYGLFLQYEYFYDTGPETKVIRNDDGIQTLFERMRRQEYHRSNVFL